MIWGKKNDGDQIAKKAQQFSKYEKDGSVVVYLAVREEDWRAAWWYTSPFRKARVAEYEVVSSQTRGQAFFLHICSTPI